jgi:parallel beta-helix repeat protein
MKRLNLLHPQECPRTPVRRIARANVITLAVLLSGLAVPSGTVAATYYVATTGNDVRGCLTAQNIRTPKRTIASGLTCLRAGDRLDVRGGTYPERIDSNTQAIPTGTSWSDAVTIAAYPGETVVLQATNVPGVVNLASRNIEYLIFDGLIFDGNNIGGEGTSAISLWGGAHHVRFINAEIKNSPYQGVTIFWGNGLSSDYHEFINCKVHHNGRTNNLDHGFYISTSNNLIEGCQIHDNKAYGIHIYAESYAANGNVIRRNRIYNNGISSENGGGIVASSGASTFVYNNLIYGNRDGIVLCCGAREEQILNNTIYLNLGYGVEVQTGSAHTVINNILRLNARGDSRFLVPVEASNNVTVDPLFHDASAADFCLEALSPAIDAGLSVGWVGNDFSGAERPQGASHDVGAMEYRANCVTP